MVLLTHEEKLKRQILESSKYASSDVPFKIKRRKVSAVRDFPKAFVHLTAQSNWIPNEALVSVGTVENLLGNDRAGDPEDDFVEPFEIYDVSQENLVHSEMHGLSYNLESEKLEPMITPDQEETLQLGGELPKSLDDADFMDQLEHESIDFMDSMKCVRNRKLKNVLKDGAHGQQVDRPSSLKLWPDTLPKLHFPRRRFPAIRCFPPGCGRDATHLSKEDWEKTLASSKNKGFGHEKATREHELFEEAVRSDVKQVTEYSDDDLEDDTVKPLEIDLKSQGSNLHQSDLKSQTLVWEANEDVRGSEGKLRKEQPRHGVIVQALMAATKWAFKCKST